MNSIATQVEWNELLVDRADFCRAMREKPRRQVNLNVSYSMCSK